MTDQPTFADLDYNSKKRKTRREVFLERMERLIPWEQLEELLRPYYPTAGRGRRPYELSVMLRIQRAAVLQPERRDGRPALRGGIGQAVRGLEALRSTAGRSLPPGTRSGWSCSRRSTLILQRRGCNFDDYGRHRSTDVRRTRRSSATLPDEEGERVAFRDAHIGVDAETGMVHRITTTPANA